MPIELIVLLTGACLLLTTLFLAVLAFLLMLAFHGYVKIVNEYKDSNILAFIGVMFFGVGFLWFAFMGLKGIWYTLFYHSIFK